MVVPMKLARITGRMSRIPPATPVGGDDRVVTTANLYRRSRDQETLFVKNKATSDLLTFCESLIETRGHSPLRRLLERVRELDQPRLAARCAGEPDAEGRGPGLESSGKRGC